MSSSLVLFLIAAPLGPVQLQLFFILLGWKERKERKIFSGNLVSWVVPTQEGKKISFFWRVDREGEVEGPPKLDRTSAFIITRGQLLICQSITARKPPKLEEFSFEISTYFW